MMHYLMRACAGAMCLVIAACGPANVATGTYAVPVDQAYLRLIGIDTSKLGDRIETEQVPNESLVWKQMLLGEEMYRYTAKLTPAGDSTQVSVEFIPTNVRSEPGTGDNSVLAQQGRLATAAELVAATLESRAYDSEKAGARINAYMITNPGAVRDDIQNGTFAALKAARDAEAPDGGASANSQSFLSDKQIAELRRQTDSQYASERRNGAQPAISARPMCNPADRDCR